MGKETLQRHTQERLMDITRHWRLKMSRNRILATRCPVTGMLILAQQGGAAPRYAAHTYHFAPALPQYALQAEAAD
jgi:hypothetical protein